MRNVQTYYKRVGYVLIEGADGVMHRYGDSELDMRFSGEKVGTVYREFEVGILGLSASTINELTVWDKAKAVAASRRIEVYAGYAGGGIDHPLFSGIIIEAMPTNPPEMWMNFKCINMNGGDVGDWRRNELFENVAIGELFGWISEDCGFGGKWRWESSRDPTDKVSFVMSGNARDNAERFAQAFDLTVFEDGGIMYARDARMQFDSPREPVVQVNQDTGMLALGNVTLAGATIKTHLSDRAMFGSWLYLTSKIVPKANGYYIVVRKKHVGHLRGEEWYTELQTIRKDARV